ncbi:MAG: glycosyltransferase family 2 protein [Microgenomates group bacterium]
MKQALISIIVVNWNGIRWLSDCFESLARQEYQNYEIIFVDNASKDESVSWVKQNYPKTKILINKENLGFSDANNVGYKVAKGEYVLFLNNDTRVTKTFLTELVAAIESGPTIGGAQSKILLMDHPDTHDSVGAFLTPTGFLYHYGFGAKDAPKYNKQIDLYTAKGACMMFKMSVLKKVEVEGNILDPSYFAYFEETDMCHRVWLAGYKIVYAYKSVMYHKMGATSSSMNNAFIQYHSFKNRINSYCKNLGNGLVWQIVPYHIFLSCCMAWFMLLKGKMSIWWAIHRAIWWNIYHISRTLKMRGTIQKKIRVSNDYQFINKIMCFPSYRYYQSFLMGSFDYEEKEIPYRKKSRYI